MAYGVIAIATDDPTFGFVVRDMLEQAGHDAFIVAADDSAVTAIAGSEAEAIVIETSMTHGFAVTLLVERLRRAAGMRHVPIVVCSPDAKFHDTYREYLRTRGCTLIGKPFRLEKLLDAVNRSSDRAKSQPAVMTAIRTELAVPS